jgi:hypothetical protein
MEAGDFALAAATAAAAIPASVTVAVAVVREKVRRLEVDYQELRKDAAAIHSINISVAEMRVELRQLSGSLARIVARMDNDHSPLGG